MGTTLNRVAGVVFTEKVAHEQDLKKVRVFLLSLA